LEEQTGPVVVVADTHLGLLDGKRFYFLRNNSRCDALGLAGFIGWLEQLQAGSARVIRGEWGDPLEVRKPSYLILLGDYLELWDASDAAVDLSSRAIWNMMERLTCKKIYLVGNHDFASSQLVGQFPQGTTSIEVYTDTYPPKELGKPTWLRVDNTNFLFLHGHQFDWAFRHLGGVWAIVSYLRDGAEAFRLWSWVLVAAAIAALFASSFLGVFQSLAMALLLAGALPRLIVTVARPLWNYVARTRYEPGKALEGFARWWKHFIDGNEIPVGQLCVVYGHTHLMDIFDSSELQKLTGTGLPRQFSLVNIPSWVLDVRDEYKKIFRDVALYIDEGCFHLLGWDWRKQQPFYIPYNVTRTLAGGLPIDDKTAESLAAIGWPEKLVAKVREPAKILGLRYPVSISRAGALLHNAQDGDDSLQSRS
jgi:predicted phosphodiesterase